MGIRRWWAFGAFVVGVAAVVVVVALATGGGEAQPAPAGDDTAGERAAEGEEEQEAEGGDDFFAMQRLGSGDVERRYLRAVRQARSVAEAATAPRRLGGSWELVGPTNVGGRITGLAVDPTQPDTVYAASASGGVWKSTDAAHTFQSAWPADLPQATGAVAVDRDGKVWVGTGEANPGGGSSTYAGEGVVVSDDGGRTWKKRGLDESHRIARIAIDPADPDRVFVAAGGPLYSPGGERGIYRTENGGASWKRVLEPETATAGGSEIAIDPSNPDRMFAALWDRIRTPSHRTYGGVGSGLYRSLDGGDTWERLDNIAEHTPGDPVGLSRDEHLGRVAVAIAPSNPERVYVLTGSYSIFGSFKGFYVSNDGGDTFTTTAALPNAGGDLWWTGQVWVDPQDENAVFIPGVNLLRSTNGGNSWASSAGMHVDHHAMAWDPNVPQRVYEGNDGGTYRSDARGASQTWEKATYEPYTQVYTIDVGETAPERVTGGLQDNGCQRSWTPTTAPAPNAWSSFGCGDGLYTLIDPSNPDIYYGCSQYGSCTRRNDQLAGQPGFSRNIGNGTTSTRRNWKTPVVIDPNDPATLYYGGNVLNKSTNRGDSWTPISPVDDPLPGLPTDLDPTYVNYGTITAVGVSKSSPGTIYVGTDTGRLWKTGDGGSSWTEFTGRGLPERWVSAVAVDPADADRAYVTFTGFFQGDASSHVWATDDGGRTWTNVSGNLPNAPVNDIVIDTERETVYVAGDVGVFFLKNDKKNWKPVGTGLPLAPVHDLRLHTPSDQLFAATFGRGVWKVPVTEGA
jgi:photosystem II stability/assembly factor-like uncharacterized protein